MNSGNDYTGPVLYPGQLSSLTMYGYPRGAFSSPKERTDATEMNSAESRSPHIETNSAPRRRLRRHRSEAQEVGHEVGEGIASRASFETSSTELQSTSGVPLSDSDTASSSFAVRAKQAGIPDWNEKVAKGLVGNNSVFDGRWVLNPDEAWNVPARKNSALTISPRSQRSGHSTRSAVDEDSSSPLRIRPLRDAKQSSQETLLPFKDQKTSKLDTHAAEFEQLDLDEQASQDDRRATDDVEGSSEESSRPMETQ